MRLALATETNTLETTPDSGQPEALLEMQFGAYRIVRLLGEGGMGSVYLGEQQYPIRRQVALKLIKLGMSTAEVIARFDSERQALALMDHPHIARVFDAGASDRGRPYFVMEYVSGIPITEYCDLHRLSNRERMELFIAVCQAVHHAHQKGIIHRDIKPSNVLVGEQDGKPFPKVIDFGVSKAIDQQLVEHATFTQMGALVGTPEYMSPEQTVLSSNIDTTTDVYSLGVLLYELLSGALPFKRNHEFESGLEELLRIIREEDPLAPSDKLSRLEHAAKVAELRRTTPTLLRRQLTGDLDWIVMKALEKDRRRRYASVSELSSDIRRYLDTRPVLAGPPDRVYRVRKFVRRHRVAVSVAMLIAVSVIAGLVSTGWEAHVAFLQRNRADAEAARALRERLRADAEAAQALLERGRSEAHAREAEAQRDRADSQRREAILQRLAAERRGYSANVAAADLYLGSNDIVEARKRLLMCPRDLRGWEWNHLFLKTDSSIATLFPIFDLDDNDDGAASFAFSEEGDRIFWYTKHTLQSWDAKTYLPAARFGGFGTIRAVSAHATRIIAQRSGQNGDKEAPLEVFDRASVKPIGALAGSSRTDHVVFAPDGVRAAGVIPDFGLTVWNTDSGKVITTIPIPNEHISFVLFSPNGARMVSGSFENPAKVWDPQSGILISKLDLQSSSATAAVFSPDNSQLFLGTRSGAIGSWDVTSGRNLRSIRENHGAVSAVAYSPDGNRILVGTRDNVVRIWDTGSGSLVSSLVGHENTVTSIAFTPDGSKILTGQVQMMVPGHITPKARVWDATHCCAVGTLAGHRGAINAVAFSPNQEIVASASDDATVRLWETTSGRTLQVLSAHSGAVLALAFSPDGTMLASGSADQTIIVWAVAGGEPLRIIRGHTGSITSLAFDISGNRLVSASKDKTLRVWSVLTGEMITTITPGEPVNGATLSPDGRHVVSGVGEGAMYRGEPSIRVWDISSGKVIIAMTQGDFNGIRATVTWAAYSPDGARVISCDTTMGRAARIWDAATGQLIATLQGPSLSLAQFPFGNVHHGAAIFQPDGRRILASWGATVQIWDAHSYEPLMALRSRTDSRCLAFSKSERFLASGFQDGTVSVWDTRSAYNPEAESLVESLFSKLVFANEVEAQLNKDNTLDKTLRADAIRFVQERGEASPYFHNGQARQVAISSTQSAREYRLALRRSQLACQLAPWDSSYWNTLGMAQYRVGAYQAALRSLARAAESSKRGGAAYEAALRFLARVSGRSERDGPNLAFTAMANHKLGNITEARAALEQFDIFMAEPNHAADPELQDLTREVKVLFANSDRNRE